MRWVAIRDCFTFDRYHYEGREYEFAANVVPHPKNFRPAGVVFPPSQTETTSTAIAVVKTLDKQVIETPKAEQPGFQCVVCGKVVRTRLALSGHSRSHKKENDGSTNKKAD